MYTFPGTEDSRKDADNLLRIETALEVERDRDEDEGEQDNLAITQAMIELEKLKALRKIADSLELIEERLDAIAEKLYDDQ